MASTPRGQQLVRAVAIIAHIFQKVVVSLRCKTDFLHTFLRTCFGSCSIKKLFLYTTNKQSSLTHRKLLLSCSPLHYFWRKLQSDLALTKASQFVLPKKLHCTTPRLNRTFQFHRVTESSEAAEVFTSSHLQKYVKMEV